MRARRAWSAVLIACQEREPLAHETNPLFHIGVRVPQQLHGRRPPAPWPENGLCGPPHAIGKLAGESHRFSRPAQ